MPVGQFNFVQLPPPPFVGKLFYKKQNAEFYQYPVLQKLTFYS